MEPVLGWEQGFRKREAEKQWEKRKYEVPQSDDGEEDSSTDNEDIDEEDVQEVRAFQEKEREVLEKPGLLATSSHEMIFIMVIFISFQKLFPELVFDHD